MDIVNAFVDYCTFFVSSGGLVFGFLLVLLESIIPILPLGVFVTLNVTSFGFFMGIFISWFATCLGCFLSYLIFYYLSNNVIYRLFGTKVKKRLEKASMKFKSIPLSNLAVIIALPFTPSFLINIIGGISGISRKKFILALFIGKIFMIFFWGYVGKSLIESITDIKTIMIIVMLILLAYFISKFVSKKADIE